MREWIPRMDGFSEGDSLRKAIQMTHFSETGKIRPSVEVVGDGGLIVSLRCQRNHRTSGIQSVMLPPLPCHICLLATV